MAHRIDHRYDPRSTWTVICHPDDSRKTLVRQDGALYRFFHNAGREQVWFGRVIEFGIASEHPTVAVRQHTENPRRPSLPEHGPGAAACPEPGTRPRWDAGLFCVNTCSAPLAGAGPVVATVVPDQAATHQRGEQDERVAAGS